MAIYNNGFPINYPQYYPQQFQYPQQNMQPQNVQQQNLPQQNLGAAQMMTPPTIHAEIVQINGKDEAVNFPVGTGQSQMMMTKDDSAIFIKTAYANGQSTLIKYTKEEVKPQETTNADYVTREEFENRIAEIMKSRKAEENE